MKNNICSKDYYNRISSQYSKIKKERESFFTSIDNLVISITKNKVDYFLDYGCGDGVRTQKIAKEINSKKTIGLDTSVQMIKIAKKYNLSKNINFYESNLETLEITNNKLNLITCLWNVFGHVSKINDKIQILKIFEEKLTNDGKVFIDVNNRYNVKAYGFFSVLKNFIVDLFYKESGFFKLYINDNYHEVYIHSIREFDQIVKKSNLKIEQKFFINYENGTIYQKKFLSQFKGQILYILGKK